MPEMHLRQPGFTYSACVPFTRNKQRIQKVMQTGDTKYIYKNELDKACFQHDMAYGKYKGLKRRSQSDQVLKHKTFEIANNPKYDGYQRGLVSVVYQFFDNKSKGTRIKSMPDQQLANQLHKPITRKFKERKECYSFKDNIWAVDLADMQLISKCIRGIKHLLCAIDLFSKHVFVVPLKDKKGTTVTNALQSILNRSKRKKKENMD